MTVRQARKSVQCFLDPKSWVSNLNLEFITSGETKKMSTEEDNKLITEG